MPDEDRLVAAIMDLTDQVARVAWALETATPGHLHKFGSFEIKPCNKCGSQLVPRESDHCAACLEPKVEATNAG